MARTRQCYRASPRTGKISAAFGKKMPSQRYCISLPLPTGGNHPCAHITLHVTKNNMNF
jgi:hypothetical protein